MNSINCIHDNEVNNIAELNLLNYIIDRSKLTKNINSHYSPVRYGYINTRRGKAKFDNFRTLLDTECSSIILMKRILTKLKTKEYSMMKWCIQAGNINNKMKV